METFKVNQEKNKEGEKNSSLNPKGTLSNLIIIIYEISETHKRKMNH